MRNENKKGLTVVELLVVLTVMALLVSLLLPAVAMVMNMANTTKQKAQFATISIALESFRNDFGDYPESYYGQNSYCGAQILSEAMVGYDLFGVHPKTKFHDDGIWDTGAADKYDADPTSTNYNGNQRKGPYIEVEKAGAVRLDSLYANTGALTATTYVLTDTFKKKNVQSPDKKFGMPILYYKARVNKVAFQTGAVANKIYDNTHNQELIDLVVPWDTTGALKPPLKVTPLDFYNNNEYIVNKNLTSPLGGTEKLPYNKDSFILISAGKDGLYGTSDDIFNFEK